MDLLQKRKCLHSVTTKSYLFHHIKHSSHRKCIHEPFLPFWFLWAALHGEIAGTVLFPSKEPLSPHRTFRALVNAFVPGNLGDFSFHSQTQSHAIYKCLTPPDIVITAPAAFLFKTRIWIHFNAWGLARAACCIEHVTVKFTTVFVNKRGFFRQGREMILFRNSRSWFAGKYSRLSFFRKKGGRKGGGPVTLYWLTAD